MGRWYLYLQNGESRRGLLAGVHRIGVAAAFLRRAERIATAYAAFREAFGRRLNHYPLIRATLDEIRTAPHCGGGTGRSRP
jgi:hypothetical protein